MKNPIILVIQTNNSVETVVLSSKKQTIKVKKGERYKVLKNEKEEILANDVIAIRKDNDLYLMYADEQELVLEEFYNSGMEASVILPNDGSGIMLDAGFEGKLFTNADGSTYSFLYAYGNNTILYQMAQEQPSLIEVRTYALLLIDSLW